MLDFCGLSVRFPPVPPIARALYRASTSWQVALMYTARELQVEGFQKSCFAGFFCSSYGFVDPLLRILKYRLPYGRFYKLGVTCCGLIKEPYICDLGSMLEPLTFGCVQGLPNLSSKFGASAACFSCAATPRGPKPLNHKYQGSPRCFEVCSVIEGYWALREEEGTCILLEGSELCLQEQQRPTKTPGQIQKADQPQGSVIYTIGVLESRIRASTFRILSRGLRRSTMQRCEKMFLIPASATDTHRPDMPRCTSGTSYTSLFWVLDVHLTSPGVRRGRFSWWKGDSGLRSFSQSEPRPLN